MNRTLPWVICCAALLISAAQFNCAYFGRLSPWKGGGFGMFATIDRPDNRFLAIAATDASGGAYTVRLTVGTINDHRLAVREAITFPTPGRLRKLANAILRADLALLSNDAMRSIPDGLLQSIYGPLVSSRAYSATALEVIGPQRRLKSTPAITKVVVTVLGISINTSTDLVSFREIATASAAEDDQ